MIYASNLCNLKSHFLQIYSIDLFGHKKLEQSKARGLCDYTTHVRDMSQESESSIHDVSIINMLIFCPLNNYLDCLGCSIKPFVTHD